MKVRVDDLPLQGRCLIEASAGTGKTWAITSLVLRLLLGANPPGATPAPPRALREILIVTFTRAATEELRTRIRQRLRTARQAFASGSAPPDDALISALLAASTAPEDDRDRLLAAELELDLANIFTIHGFASRVLKRNAFESGISFAAEIAADDATLVRRTILDFWRERVYPLQGVTAALLLARTSYAEFEKLLRGLLNRQQLQLLNVPTDGWQRRLAEITVEEERLLSAWRDEKSTFDDVMAQTQLNKKGREGLAQARLRLDAVLDGKAQLDQPSVLGLSRDFLTSELAKKKNNALPELAVFDSAQRLLASAELLYRCLLAEALLELPRRLAAIKEHTGQLGYDDLLRLLDEGLQGDAGARLAATIREQYPVALIDEFQDTDLRQWQVFSRIYDSPESALFLVGDPKQAIYAFRGADVHAYLRARDSADIHCTLEVNYRSVQPLVEAVNRLFLLREDHDPFLAGATMRFEAVQASGKPDAKPLCLDGQPLAALQVLHLQPPASDAADAAPPASQAYCEQMADASANHLAGLLAGSAAGRLELGGERLRPGDIACLVRNRSEARLLAGALTERGVDSVYLSHDSVFASAQAEDLYLVLAAVLEPGSATRVRAALGCALLGRDALELAAYQDDDNRLLREQERFLSLAQQLRHSGVQAALRRLLFDYDVAPRLLARTDGERALTNCLHLIELLQEEREELDTDEALLTRFAALIAHGNDAQREAPEAALLRLQSDADRVQIVTLHASKGLEYPLVYLPFTAVSRPAQEALFHPGGEHRISYDLAGEQASLDAADGERLAEDLRLFYVGITRATHCCVLGIGDLRRGNSKKSSLAASAPGHLLDAARLGAAPAMARLASLPGVTMIDAASLPHCSLNPVPPANPVLAARHFTAPIERDWQASSYSALVSRIDAEAARAFRQPELRGETGSTPRGRDVFGFPRGARHGSFLHELFEKLDFSTPAASPAHAQLLASALHRGGYEADWLPVLQRLVDDVLDCPLDDDSLRLRTLGADGSHVTELAFEFPLAGLDTRALNALLASHDPLSHQGPALAPARVNGMLSGFIDLVFEHQGRYYLADYKSNHLGDTLDAYVPERLAASIAEHRYDLQYTLYTLALTRLLRQRLGASFDYERHVGGVYYLYLRGMRAQAGASHGVWQARPTRELIEALDALCGGGEDHGD